MNVLAQVAAAFAAPAPTAPSLVPQASQEPDPELTTQLESPKASAPVLVATVAEPSRDLPGAMPNTSQHDAKSVKELRLMATQRGIDNDVIERARDAHDPHAELIALIQRHDNAPSPAPVDYGSMSVKELRNVAAKQGVAHEAIEAARDGDDPKADLIALITTQSTPKQGP